MVGARVGQQKFESKPLRRSTGISRCKGHRVEQNDSVLRCHGAVFSLNGGQASWRHSLDRRQQPAYCRGQTFLNDAVNIAARGLIYLRARFRFHKSGGSFYDFQLDEMDLARRFLDPGGFRARGNDSHRGAARKP
jgi:hypothetical protein